MAEAALTLENPSTTAHWMRRLHSLTGIIPIGAFLVFHTFENLKAVGGPDAYNEAIGGIANMLPGPYLLAVELLVLAAPILFHGLYGLIVAFQASPNTSRYGYRQNWYYLLQRISGVLALAFIVYHVWALRISVTLMERGAGIPGHPGYVSFSDVAFHFSNPVVATLYVIGILASAFHLGNGLSGFCWTWGITVTERSRKIVEVLGWIVFLAISIPMLHIILTFRA